MAKSFARGERVLRGAHHAYIAVARRAAAFLLALLAAWVAAPAAPARASVASTAPGARLPQQVDTLLFCNQPERLQAPGAYADALLTGGRTYRIFFHYRNVTGAVKPLVIAFQGSVGKPLTVDIRKGIADPQNDPPQAGQQAMARYLKAPDQRFVGKGGVRLPMNLRPWDVASGVLTVRADQDVRLRIYFQNNNQVVTNARVTAVKAPHRDVTIALSPEAAQQYYRIGIPEEGMTGGMDGAYGLVYTFHVQAPAGSKVRVTFSPRGGQSGLVAALNGLLVQSRIVPPKNHSVFAEAKVGPNGLALVTIPFGGVFYPVEMAFHLLP